MHKTARKLIGCGVLFHAAMFAQAVDFSAPPAQRWDGPKGASPLGVPGVPYIQTKAVTISGNDQVAEYTWGIKFSTKGKSYEAIPTLGIPATVTRMGDNLIVCTVTGGGEIVPTTRTSSGISIGEADCEKDQDLLGDGFYTPATLKNSDKTIVHNWGIYGKEMASGYWKKEVGVAQVYGEPDSAFNAGGYVGIPRTRGDGGNVRDSVVRGDSDRSGNVNRGGRTR